ncbi:MAG: hypothetical protein ABIH29_04605 [Candidatus Micrarchaeota archaeon]
MKNMVAVAEEKAGSLLRYRDGLTDGNRQVFDRLVTCAREHVGACALAGDLTLFESMLLGMVIEQQKKIEQLSTESPLAGLENV